MIAGISDGSISRASLPAAMLVLMMLSGASAQQRFQMPDQAVKALVGALRIGDRVNMLKILGKEATEIVSSGDDAADAAQRQRFVSAYDAKHHIQPDGDSRMIVIVGQEDFPFPIPLVRANDMWQFDTAAGKQEILYRRIGRNEL